MQVSPQAVVREIVVGSVGHSAAAFPEGQGVFAVRRMTIFGATARAARCRRARRHQRDWMFAMKA